MTPYDRLCAICAQELPKRRTLFCSLACSREGQRRLSQRRAQKSGDVVTLGGDDETLRTIRATYKNADEAELAVRRFLEERRLREEAASAEEVVIARLDVTVSGDDSTVTAFYDRNPRALC